MLTGIKPGKSQRLVIRCECDMHQAVMLFVSLRVASWSLAEYSDAAFHDVWIYRVSDGCGGRKTFEIQLSEHTLQNLKPEFIIARIRDKWRNLQARRLSIEPDETDAAITAAAPPEFTVMKQNGFSIHESLLCRLYKYSRYFHARLHLSWNRYLGL